MITHTDRQMLMIAYEEAKRGFDEGGCPIGSVLARGGKVVMLGSEAGIAKAGEGCMATISLPPLDAFISPILYALPLQLLAYYAAVAKGTDVDQPRNLAKSVTVE